MTQEELIAKIAELEAENAKLKQDIDRIGNAKPTVGIKARFGEKYPWSSYLGEYANKLSLVVRKACFPKTNKMSSRAYRDGTRKVGCEYVIETKEMTDEQRERYLNIIGRILGVLDEYEIISDEIEEKYGRKIRAERRGAER